MSDGNTLVVTMCPATRTVNGDVQDGIEVRVKDSGVGDVRRAAVAHVRAFLHYEAGR